MEITIKTACKLKLRLENTYKDVQAGIFFQVEDDVKAQYYLYSPSVFYFSWSLESIKQQIELLHFRKF